MSKLRRPVNCPPTFGVLRRLFYSRKAGKRAHGYRTSGVWPEHCRRLFVEHHGTFGTIWASLGMTAYYMAITWINVLLGLFLSPLFMIPITWIQDRFAKR